MKLIRYSFLCLLLVFTTEGRATEDSLSVYDRHRQSMEQFWMAIAPNHFKLQFAGSIGVVSAGLGWHYGRHHNNWETDLMFGYLPKFSSKTAHGTFTVRQTYIPWNLHLKGDFSCYPLTCGMFVSTVTGSDFWANQPTKYPKKYYGFSTKIRLHAFVGQRIKFNIPKQHRIHNKSIEAYHELSTCDLYIASYVRNHYLSLWDILSLSFGLKFESF